MANPNQSAVLKLSERAQIVIHRMLDRKLEPTSIVKAVAKETGEKISRFCIARYATHYASLQEQSESARLRTEALVRQIKKSGTEVSDMLRAAFHESFEKAREKGALIKMNPLQFEAAERRRLELALKRKQVSLAERRVKVFEDRLKLDRKKAQAAVDKLDRKARRGESLSAEDVRQIREIYGLSESFENDWNSEERAMRVMEAEDDHRDAKFEDGEKQAGSKAKR